MWINERWARRLVLLLLGPIVTFGIGCSGSPRRKSVDIVTLDYKDSDFTEVIRSLSEQAGRNMVVDAVGLKEVKPGTVTVFRRKASFVDAVRTLENITGMAFVNEGYYSVATSPARAKKLQGAIAALRNKYRGNIEGTEVSLELVDARFADAIYELSKQSELTVVLLKSAIALKKPVLNVSLHDVPAVEALSLIAVLSGVTWRNEGGKFLVGVAPRTTERAASCESTRVRLDTILSEHGGAIGIRGPYGGTSGGNTYKAASYYSTYGWGGERQVDRLKRDLDGLLKSGVCSNYRPVIARLLICCSIRQGIYRKRARASSTGKYLDLSDDYDGLRMQVESVLAAKEYQDRITSSSE